MNGLIIEALFECSTFTIIKINLCRFGWLSTSLLKNYAKRNKLTIDNVYAFANGPKSVTAILGYKIIQKEITLPEYYRYNKNLWFCCSDEQLSLILLKYPNIRLIE